MFKLISYVILVSIITFATISLLIAQDNAGDSTEIWDSQDPVCFEVISLHTITLKDSSKVEEFEAFVRSEYNALTKENFPGMRWFISKADRGSKLGEYLLFADFDTKERRDEIFTAKGHFTESYQPIWKESVGNEVMSQLRKYAIRKWISDYRVVGDVDESHKMLAQRSVPDPACFGLIGLFNVTLKDSSKAEEFEAFLNDEYNALTKENFPGMRFIVLKADLGQKIGEYISLAVFDSAERRDKYFPGEGHRSEDFDKKWKEIGGPEIMNQFRKYAKFPWVSDYRAIQ